MISNVIQLVVIQLLIDQYAMVNHHIVDPIDV